MAPTTGGMSAPEFPGVPEKSFWSGISLKDRTPIEITTWRCRSCGFLENYAV